MSVLKLRCELGRWSSSRWSPAASLGLCLAGSCEWGLDPRLFCSLAVHASVDLALHYISFHLFYILSNLVQSYWISQFKSFPYHDILHFQMCSSLSWQLIFSVSVKLFLYCSGDQCMPFFLTLCLLFLLAFSLSSSLFPPLTQIHVFLMQISIVLLQHSFWKCFFLTGLCLLLVHAEIVSLSEESNWPKHSDELC